jgi:hypothetical protein
MNTQAIDALKRARIRIAAHPWRQGPTAKQFTGYTIRSAIVGKGDGKGTEAEQDALFFARDAAQGIYRAKDIPEDDNFLDAWNDVPGRTTEQVKTVLNAAIGYAEKARDPETSPAVDLAAPIAAPAAVIPAPPAELVAEAIALGYEADATWSEDRLKAAIAAAKVSNVKLAIDAAKLPDPEEVRIKPMPEPKELKKLLGTR